MKLHQSPDRKRGKRAATEKRWRLDQGPHPSTPTKNHTRAVDTCKGPQPAKERPAHTISTGKIIFVEIPQCECTKPKRLGIPALAIIKTNLFGVTLKLNLSTVVVSCFFVPCLPTAAVESFLACTVSLVLCITWWASQDIQHLVQHLIRPVLLYQSLCVVPRLLLQGPWSLKRIRCRFRWA